MRQALEFAASLLRLSKVVIAFAVLFGAAQFAGSTPARAGCDNCGERGGDRPDYGADHDDIYQVQRGDRVCNSREACGGALAIPMNRPGWFYLPGGLLWAQHPYLPAHPIRRAYLPARHPIRRKF